MEELFGTLLTFVPLFVVILLANFAERFRERERSEDGIVFAVLAYALLVMLYSVTAAIGCLILILVSPGQEIVDGLRIANPALLGGGTLAASLVGMLILLRPVRRLLSRLIPIDPLSTVHAVSLSFIMLVLMQIIFTVGIGLGELADFNAASEALAGEGTSVTVVGAWFQAAVMVIFAAVGVGWLVRRGFRATRDRLGIVRPSMQNVIVGVLLGAAMVGVIIGIEALASAMGWGFDEDVERLTEQMLGGLMTSVIGVITIGLAAGIGEETLMRGAVQPRFGLILTAATFALLHANYGISLSTLAVFLVGLVLGIVRIRANTTTAMILHATYNIILSLMAFLAMPSP